MAAQVAMEEIARSEAVATEAAVERGPVVVKRRPPQVMTLRSLEEREAVRDGCGIVLSVLVVAPATGVFPMLKVAVFVANAIVATAFFGGCPPIAVIGRCRRGSRQPDRSQSHHCDRETRSVVAKHHGEPPIACSDGFDACSLGKFTGGPEASLEEKLTENARKSLRRESI